jgi:hypothetical protein
MIASSRSLWMFASALLVASAMALGQTVTGGITGQVTDASGAVLPGAQVVAHNMDTGVNTPVKTNGDGFYRINFLPIGHYQVMVTAAGFNEETLPAFTLEVLQTPTFNVKMSVGGASTSVDVSAAAPILNTSDPTLGTTFTANVIQNFPLNGLDFSALTLYLPGSVDTAGTSGTTSLERSTQYTDTPNMNGNRAQANNYTLDGIDMNESFNNLIAYSPAPDALEEVKVLTANSPADYGNVNGGGVVSVLKTGTNKFHGSAYGYTQNQNFNANSWENNDQTPKLPKNAFSQSQFGGTLGGPVLHNKLFFFVDYLGSRYHTGGSATASVFTAAMRTGDFSALLDPNVMCPGYTGTTPCPQLIQLYDTQNNFMPYMNNQIPIVNPVAKFLVANPQYYPLPNAQPASGTPAQNNLQGFSRNFQANNQGDIKIEYDHAADKLTGFYSMSTAYSGSTALLPITFPGVSLYPTKIVGANWVHTFSPQLVNSGRIGFTRVVWSTGLPGDPTGQFGLSGDAKVGIPFGNQSYAGFSNQGIGSNFSNVGTPAQGGGFIDNTYSYIDNLTWQKGLHTLSMGVEAIRYQTNYPTSNNYGYLGSLNYRGYYTENPSPAVTNGLGYAAADFMLDRVYQAAVTSSAINVGQRQWRTAEFFSDDWHVLPNLTINLGVRYEIDEPWIEQNNKTGNVDLTTGQTIYADHVPAGAPAGSGICKNRGCYQYNYRQIMPRLGFAYQASDRFVIRGGYGATSFYEGNSANQRLTSITPFIQAVNIQATIPSYTAASGTTPAVLNGGTPRTVENGFTYTDPTDLSLSGSYNVYPQNIQPAYVQEWSLTSEYALTRTLSLQVGYIGEQGQHIEDYGNVNQPTDLTNPNSAPFASNPNFGTGSLLITESRAAMNFQAMESTLRQRVSHGLEFTLNYTYGKALTNSLGNYGLQVNGFSGAFQNYYDSHADWGVAGYDVRHNVSATGVYALPVGRGQEYFPHANRFVDAAVGGWKVSFAAVSYSGFPDTVTGPGNNSQNEGGNYRANQYRKLKVVHHSIQNWFGTDPSATPCPTPGVDNGVCAFGPATSTTFGTSSNGAVRGPGYLNVDGSAFKDFRIVEGQTFGFSFQAFNALNIASYGNPDTGVTDSTFGNIASQGTPVRSTERRLQFSARYSF